MLLVLTTTLSQVLCLQAMYQLNTSLLELSSMTWLTQLRISTHDYQTATGSLQCLSALRRLRDLKVVDMQHPGSRTATGLATVPPLSYCTALTRLGHICVSTEVHTRTCIGSLLPPSWVLLVSDMQLFCATAMSLIEALHIACTCCRL
jgi:hypothetical protein